VSLVGVHHYGAFSGIRFHPGFAISTEPQSGDTFGIWAVLTYKKLQVFLEGGLHLLDSIAFSTNDPILDHDSHFAFETEVLLDFSRDDITIQWSLGGLWEDFVPTPESLPLRPFRSDIFTRLTIGRESDHPMEWELTLISDIYGFELIGKTELSYYVRENLEWIVRGDILISRKNEILEPLKNSSRILTSFRFRW